MFVLPLPSRKNPIACKWVYQIRYNVNGSVKCYKARLVVKGFTQVDDIDFVDTFSPVDKIVIFQLLMALDAHSNRQLIQLNVNNVFFNGTLTNKEVYIHLLPRHIATNKRLVCKLNKYLYGLRQASKEWYNAFSSVVARFGFVRSVLNHSLFTKESGSSFIVLLVCVDDIILVGLDMNLIKSVRTHLQQHLKLKDFVFLKYFLGFEIARNNTGISVSQRHYTLQLLFDVRCLVVKHDDLSLASAKLAANFGHPLTDPQPNRWLVGHLMYLTYTRPDITYTVLFLYQFVAKLGDVHLKAAYHLLCYLNKSPRL